MDYLLTPKNLKALKSFSISGTVFAFDFDGTLAPIVENPAKARMTPKVEELLKKLNNLFPVAIITGRSIADIRPRLSFGPKFLIGNHGVEGTQTAEELKMMKSLCQSWRDELLNNYHGVFQRLGASIEDKDYTLTIHYRGSPAFEAAQVEIPKILGTLKEAKISPGKSVFNVAPAMSVNKGEALKRLMERENFNFAFFIGDDRTDEDVFNLKDQRMFTVKVGDSAESSARFCIRNQGEIEELLECMVKFLSST